MLRLKTGTVRLDLMVLVEFLWGSVVQAGSIPVAAHFLNIKSSRSFAACVTWWLWWKHHFSTTSGFHPSQWAYRATASTSSWMWRQWYLSKLEPNSNRECSIGFVLLVDRVVFCHISVSYTETSRQQWWSAHFNWVCFSEEKRQQNNRKAMY